MQGSSPGDTAATVAEVRCRIDDEAAAMHLLDHLVGQRLAACGHLDGAAPARYWWRGELVHDREYEVRLITTEHGVDAVVEALRRLHHYELPGITWNTVATTAEYAAWVQRETAHRA